MSGTHEGAPIIDPLDALRAADHRPAHEVWRERIGLWLQNADRPTSSDYRSDLGGEHGPFGDVDALVAVRGIGPATLDAIRDHVTVG